MSTQTSVSLPEEKDQGGNILTDTSLKGFEPAARRNISIRLWDCWWPTLLQGKTLEQQNKCIFLIIKRNFIRKKINIGSMCLHV